MIADIDIDSECIRFMGSLRMDIWGARCVVGMRKYKGRLSYLPPPSERKDASSSIIATSMPLLSEPIPSDWKVIEDDILLLWASQVPYAAQTNYNSPPSSLQDGVFQICLVRGKHVGRVAMASILIGLDHGNHADHPDTEFIECVAYRLEPLCEGSHNDLDGELIESGPIQAQVTPGALQIFGASKRGK
jgi:sphingosine kinase